jgi:hypothetical protein
MFVYHRRPLRPGREFHEVRPLAPITHNRAFTSIMILWLASQPKSLWGEWLTAAASARTRREWLTAYGVDFKDTAIGSIEESKLIKKFTVGHIRSDPKWGKPFSIVGQVGPEPDGSFVSHMQQLVNF